MTMARTYKTNQYMDLSKRLREVEQERQALEYEEEVLKDQMADLEPYIDRYFLAKCQAEGVEA